MWLIPHPSVHRLQPSSCVWVPIEEDYGGINDRHALLDRTGASAYLGRWNMLLSGKVLDIAPCMRERQCTQSSERLTAATIIYHNLTVCRFPSAAFLQCCRDAHRGVCYKTACHKWHWPLQKQAVGLTQNTSANISAISGKYPKEVRVWCACVVAAACSVTIVLPCRRAPCLCPIYAPCARLPPRSCMPPPSSCRAHGFVTRGSSFRPRASGMTSWRRGRALSWMHLEGRRLGNGSATEK